MVRSSERFFPFARLGWPRIQLTFDASIFATGSQDPERRFSMPAEDKDQSVLNHINALVKEEERLYGKRALTEDDTSRLDALKVELDQCWDLLRQRRALREFGEDPDKAKVRPAKIVENYEQ
jgi:hypothetical protein